MKRLWQITALILLANVFMVGKIVAREHKPLVPLTQEEWQRENEAAVTREIKDEKSKESGKFRFNNIELLQHIVHYAPLNGEKNQGLERQVPIMHSQRGGSGNQPIEGKSLEYAFALDMKIDYDVLNPINAYLTLNDEWCYWKTWNYKTGRRGFLYSYTPIPLNVKGPNSVNIRISRGWSYIEKGVNIIGATHGYRLNGTDNNIPNIRIPGNTATYASAWGETEPNGNLKFYPTLLYAIANLSKIKLNFEDFHSAWKENTPFVVKLILTDGDGDKINLPRANITGYVFGNGQKVKISLESALYAHSLPKGYFKGMLPAKINPKKIELNGTIIYLDPEGKERKAEVSAVYQKNTGYLEEEKIDAPVPTEKTYTKEGQLLETRFLFVHYPGLRRKEEIDDTIARMKKANLNVLVGQFHDAWWGVGWKSEYAPNISLFRYGKDFDALAYTLQAAHKEGIEVHSVFWPFDIGRFWPDEWRKKMSPYLDTQAICKNSVHMDEYFGKLAKELVQNYNIDGICLDGIRTTGGCFCDECKRAYHEKTGRDLWYDRTNYFPFPEEFTRWHEGVVTKRLMSIRNAAIQINPKLIFSACVQAISSPSIRDRTIYGQPAHVWLKDGKLDFVMPMSYRHNIWEAVVNRLDYLKEAQVAGKPYAVGVLLDLHLRPGELRRSKPPELLLEQIKACQRSGFKNFGFYWGSWLDDDMARALIEGPFKEKAVPFWKK